MVANISQGDILLICLDPTVGYEIQKTRPCLVISPNEMNKYLKTIIVAPMTTKSHNYPTRPSITFQGKSGYVVLDQIRTVDKERIVRSLGKINNKTLGNVKLILNKIFF